MAVFAAAAVALPDHFAEKPERAEEMVLEVGHRECSNHILELVQDHLLELVEEHLLELVENRELT